MPEVLRFGITSLDELFGVPSETSKPSLPAGIYLPSPPNGDEVLDNTITCKAVPTTSVCIVGPTGTGKSIFALHMASTYLTDCRTEGERAEKHGRSISLPTVLYVSTDLTHNMAERAWRNFSLDRPARRREPFIPDDTQVQDDIEIRLKDCQPISLAAEFDITETEKTNVIYLDMAGYTAGDDWGFLHKILSLLPAPQDGDPRHLVIIDAIEGFEALAGPLNAFGERSTRRSRIAQVMRLISGKCHALLVVEQEKGGVRASTLDEEFVADTVIRLDSQSTRNYERRVLKVEKCRGQSHIRGQHHYSIRSGKGSTTGEQMNPDDPEVPAFSSLERTAQSSFETSAAQADPHDKQEDSSAKTVEVRQRTQGYVQVFHSVHRISRKIMEETRTPDDKKPKKKSRPYAGYAAFGIKYLDNMLGGKTEFTERGTVARVTEGRFYYDTRGLPCGSTTALIGDSLTQKSRLGQAFLSRCFYSFDKRLLEIRGLLSHVTDNSVVVEDLWQRILRKVSLSATFPSALAAATCKSLLTAGDIRELIVHLESIVGRYSILARTTKEKDSHNGSYLLTQLAAWLLDYKGGVAVMLATHNTEVDSLAKSFINWLHPEEELRDLKLKMRGYQEALRNYIKRGTVCRRLEIHSLSSEVLVHIVSQCIRDAQKKLMKPDEVNNPYLRQAESWPVRVVIDDFSSLRHMFPELREDPLLFPSILFHLEREGVTTLIIDTQSGRLETPVVERFETELRQMVHHRLYTWRVPFYGESRVAITAIPPLSLEYAGIVRELRWGTESVADVHGEPAIVDPHFELYSGLEENNPVPVPLQMRLYVDTPAMEKYIQLENAFLGEIFESHMRGQDATNKSMITGILPSEYGDLRSFAYLQRDTRLDHSYVFEVDEFWLMRPPTRHKRAGAFQPQWSYMDAVTASSNVRPAKPSDYQPNLHADPYELFQLRNQDDDPKKDGKQSLELRRRHFYEQYYCDFEGYDAFENGSKDKFHLDRVPFAWDFGFLLCQHSAWERNNRLVNLRDPDGAKRAVTVKQIWNWLAKAQYAESPTQTTAGSSRYVSWRTFAEACKKAAEEQSAKSSKRVTAFDFAQVSPESFSCLILEMWLSQVYDSLTSRAGSLKGNQPEKAKSLLHDREKLVNAVRKRRLFIPVDQPKESPEEPHSLLALLKKYWLELYITWLLLIEIVDLPSVIGDATLSTFDFKSKNADFGAVASRHWYKTATQCPDEIAAREPLVAVRLPGRFSVRGDWFLASAGGSRSVRQAERAVDLLSSRRANVTRLQMGVGLPTRVPRPDKHGALFTKLISHEHGQDNLEYNIFLKIAAKNDKIVDDGKITSDDEKFYWLWRSRLEGYAQCNRIWHRWLNRTLLWWHRKLLRYRSAWINSFDVCDALLLNTNTSFAPTRAELNDHRNAVRKAKSSYAKKKLRTDFLKKYAEAKAIAQLDIRVEFVELLDGLIEELQQVSVKSRK